MLYICNTFMNVFELFTDMICVSHVSNTSTFLKKIFIFIWRNEKCQRGTVHKQLLGVGVWCEERNHHHFFLGGVLPFRTKKTTTTTKSSLPFCHEDYGSTPIQIPNHVKVKTFKGTLFASGPLTCVFERSLNACQPCLHLLNTKIYIYLVSIEFGCVAPLIVRYINLSKTIYMLIT